MTRFRGGLVFKVVYYSALGWREIKKKKKCPPVGASIRPREGASGTYRAFLSVSTWVIRSSIRPSADTHRGAIIYEKRTFLAIKFTTRIL